MTHATRQQRCSLGIRVHLGLDTPTWRGGPRGAPGGRPSAPTSMDGCPHGDCHCGRGSRLAHICRCTRHRIVYERSPICAMGCSSPLISGSRALSTASPHHRAAPPSRLHAQSTPTAGAVCTSSQCSPHPHPRLHCCFGTGGGTIGDAKRWTLASQVKSSQLTSSHVESRHVTPRHVTLRHVATRH